MFANFATECYMIERIEITLPDQLVVGYAINLAVVFTYHHAALRSCFSFPKDLLYYEIRRWKTVLNSLPETFYNILLLEILHC